MTKSEALRSVARFIVLLPLRLCLPFSFLIACVFAPVTMLRNLRDLPGVFRMMWEDPL